VHAPNENKDYDIKDSFYEEQNLWQNVNTSL
jgi:hypothetical protein